jgi:hypothetical protein
MLPGILAGTQTLETEEDLWWAWQLYWHRDEREAARRVLGMAESRVRFPAAWWVSHARTCIAACSEQGLRIPLEPGEDVVLRQEALGLMKRAVAAARAGTQHARSWVKWAHTEKAFAAVREPEGLKSLPPEERAAWTALWTSVDEVLATSPKPPAGKGDGTGKDGSGKDAGSDGGK